MHKRPTQSRKRKTEEEQRKKEKESRHSSNDLGERKKEKASTQYTFYVRNVCRERSYTTFICGNRLRGTKRTKFTSSRVLIIFYIL
jgi:hypothetical protein